MSLIGRYKSDFWFPSFSDPPMLVLCLRGNHCCHGQPDRRVWMPQKAILPGIAPPTVTFFKCLYLLGMDPPGLPSPRASLPSGSSLLSRLEYPYCVPLLHCSVFFYRVPSGFLRARRCQKASLCFPPSLPNPCFFLHSVPPLILASLSFWLPSTSP